MTNIDLARMLTNSERTSVLTLDMIELLFGRCGATQAVQAGATHFVDLLKRIFGSKETVVVAFSPPSPNVSASSTKIAITQRIRYRARKEQLIARKSRKYRLWYFSDFSNVLCSPEQGLNDDDALAFLNQTED